MSEQTEKIVYVSTYGPEDPEKASLPFVFANAALVMDVEVVMALQANAVNVAKQGCLQHVFAASLAPLEELVNTFLSLGGRLLVCAPCIQGRKLEESDLIEGAEVTAAAKLTQEQLTATTTLVY